MCIQEYFQLVALLGGLSSFGVSFIGGFTVPPPPYARKRHGEGHSMKARYAGLGLFDGLLMAEAEVYSCLVSVMIRWCICAQENS